MPGVAAAPGGVGETGGVRLFVAVWPPEEVLAGLGDVVATARTAAPGARWVGREQWHVTLRFLGDVPDPGPVADALAAAPLPAAEAVVGPRATALGRTVLVLPVAGLDGLAAAVATATDGLGAAPDALPFRGHLTLARAPRRARLPAGLPGRVPAFGRRFPVTAAHLVRSHLTSTGPRYEDLAILPTRA